MGRDMNVQLLATTAMRPHVLTEAYGYESTVRGEAVMSSDSLAEAAGRICYKSFDRPNPKTARNRDYLANIISQGHYSVMEHASVTFLVQDVSRALLAELTRHRHLSFSVVSQRYVNYADTAPVIPPAAEGTPAETAIKNAYAGTLRVYEYLVEDLTARGFKRKQAREAARSVLPNAAPVDMIVTGNLRAWRDVLGKRHHVAADAEIREFAGRVLRLLRVAAPACVQDVPAAPYGSEGK
jgi:thymidylate synthase (FAD)